MDEEQILYDLIVHEEWEQEPQLLDQVENYFWQYRGSLLKKLWKVSQSSFFYMVDTVKTQFRYQASFGCPPIHFINLVNHCLPWMVALTRDALLLAILEDSVIEIRSSANYEQIISKCKVGKDAFPKWRKLIWNNDNTLLCYCNSFGDITIFDVTSAVKHRIPSTSASAGLKVPGTLSLAVAFMEFIVPNGGNENTESNHLFVSTYQGLLNAYEISDSSCKHLWSFSLIPYHPNGIACMVYDPKNNLLIAAGNYGKEPFPNVMGDECYGSHSAISVWRLLHDSPYLTLVEDRGKALRRVSRREWLKNIVLRRGGEQKEMLKHGIFRMKLSHDGSQIVTLHLDGRISFWSVPSMRLIRTWSKSEQPDTGGSGESGFSLDAQKKEDITNTANVINLNWWSDKDIVLVSGNGNLTISSCETLTNLLGESSEKFDPWPSLSQVVDGGILVLECEKRVSDPTNKSKTATKKWLAEEDEEHEEMDSLRYRFKELSKQMLYLLTEAERFLPAIKPPRVLTNVYRLLCLKSTTPEELYARKINLEHYGDALDLAKRFGLNTDLVYQKQWRNKRVTKITIHDYLSKIKDREWVLDECILRVPDDFDSTEQLLKYGLLGTSWDLLHRIDEPDSDKLPFNLESKKQTEHAHDGDDIVDDKTFTGTLTPKQSRLCKYRRQLLHYLDRLSTYEVILGGSFKARDKFSKEYFSKFRSCNIVHHAVETARDEDAYSLEHLFSYHGKQLLPYWLPILSNFPETTDIRYFEQVIPELGEVPVDPEILPWLEKHHRDPDWVEQTTILQQIKEDNEEMLGEFIFDEEPDLRPFYKCETKKQLKEWFLHRVHRIDQVSGQIDKCCEFLDVGIQRGLPELKELAKDFETWSILVYDVGNDSKMTAKEFLKLSNTSKVHLLMSKSSEETFVKDFGKFLLPFLKNIGNKDYKKRQDLLHEFLVEIAKTDLTCCLKLFEACSPEMSEPLLPDIGEVMKIAIDCIFACKRTDQLNHCFAIVECLPSREEEVISRQIEELHVKLDQLEHLLIGAEILQHYQNPQPISYIAETKLDAHLSEQIFHQLIKNAVCNRRCTAKDLNKSLEHVIRLSKQVFTKVEVKMAHEIFVKGLLRSGTKENILLAQELITPSKVGGLAKKQEQHLTSALHSLEYDVSVNVALEAAQEYYDSAMSLSDSSMELAKLCLSLIKDSPQVIQDELDLINSLYLLNEFNVSMLPLQVRLSPDKLEIIDLCLKEKKNGYKKKDKLLQLSHLLKICGNDVKERTGQVHIKIAESAYEHKDFSYVGMICIQLVEENYAPSWWICRKLGECNKYTNYTIRKRLLSFALTYCPLHHIEEVLKEKTTLETQLLYEELSVDMKDDVTNTSDGKEEIDGNNTSSLLSKTTTTTKKLISSVADTRWIGGAINWVSISSNDKHESFDSSREVNELVFHPFYQSMVMEKDIMKFNFEELTDHLTCNTSEKKLFNQLLLRSQKLSEHRSGEIDQERSLPAIQSLCEIAYNEESCMSLAYMMAMNRASDVQAIHDKRNKNTFTFLFAAYFYALQEYVRRNAIDLNGKADVYSASPKEVIAWLLGVLGREKSANEGEENENVTYFLSNMNKLQDLMQAKMLQALDKGVDIGRFAVDDEYKRETILGLAMSLEDELINTSLLLADKYDIPPWEVMLSHVEFLFTDSGLKAKAIRESLTKWKVESYLKPHGDEVFERMKKYVYPEINGKDHNALLLFYVFLLNCSSANKILEGTLTLDAHSKLLKKIKSAASSVNYKELVHGDSPLVVIRDCVDDNNVHLLAKIASKIPQADGTYLTPNTIFLANAIRMFWKKGENKDWLHQYENCKQYFAKLDVNDIVTFADQVTFTEEAFALLSQDVRSDICNRIFKYLRQQKGQEESKRVASDDFDDLMKRFESAIEHIELSIKHLKKLSDPCFKDIMTSNKESSFEFGKRFDLSHGNQQALQELFKDMFVTQQPLSVISSLYSLCANSMDIKDSFQAALKCLLNEVQGHKDFSILSTLITDVENHQKSNEKNPFVTANDILEVVRPFCSDVTVSTEIKSRLLNILQDSVNLAEEDVMLLNYYQSQSVIGPIWGFEISDSRINTEESRAALFDELLGVTSNQEQTCGLEKLLSSWPVFSAESDHHDESCPWIRLILKKIEIGDIKDVVEVLRMAKRLYALTKAAYLTVYEKLCAKNQVILSCKWMLSSGNDDCHNVLFEDLSAHKKVDFSTSDIDDELVKLILSTGLIHRFTNVSFYSDVINRIVANPDDKKSIKLAAAQLRNNGFESEAGFLILKTRDFKESFFTLNNSLDILKFKFRS